jgi:hypothetical protein
MELAHVTTHVLGRGGKARPEDQRLIWLVTKLDFMRTELNLIGEIRNWIACQFPDILARINTAMNHYNISSDMNHRPL